jgi:hypothetical protein
MACYSGPNPVTDPNDRATIWKWAKENGIDSGLPYGKIHDAINQQFFSGMARPEWIHDILGGRKSPLREVSNAAWKAQYNRRVITQQAREISKVQAFGPVGKALNVLSAIPRYVATYGHGVVFPVTHGGDLALRPESWGTFFRGVFNSWTKSWSPAATERLLDSMKRDPLYDTALRSGLDVGETSRAGNLIGKKGGVSDRAWEVLTNMRYELWNREMQKFITPDMSQEQVLDIGKNLASWANHATGSVKTSIPVLGRFMFGPKLTGSKLARLGADWGTTFKTFANWSNATAGEKAVAFTRFSGAMQYFGTMMGFLAVNQGVLSALGQKDQINIDDPTKSDFLAFKGGGLEFSLPGMHTEIKTLGKLLAASVVDEKSAQGKAMLRGRSKEQALAEIAGQWAMYKAAPSVTTAKEILTRQDWLGRPMPWSANPGTEKKPRLSWGEYFGSHLPIPLTGPISYVYDQMRKGGMNVGDAVSVVRGLLRYGLSPEGIALGVTGATGIHGRAVPPAAPPMRARHPRAQLAR